MALAGASIYHRPACLGGSRVHAQQKTANHIEVHQARQITAEYQDFFCALEEASELNEARPPEIRIDRYENMEAKGPR